MTNPVLASIAEAPEGVQRFGVAFDEPVMTSPLEA
jgi:hypothetical protein